MARFWSAALVLGLLAEAGASIVVNARSNRAEADAVARPEPGAPLAHDDLTAAHRLSRVRLDPQALRV